jgi:hypothetical protein
VLDCDRFDKRHCQRLIHGYILIKYGWNSLKLPDSDPDLNSSSLVQFGLKFDYILHILQEDVC